jgi:hypothetical protein
MSMAHQQVGLSDITFHQLIAQIANACSRIKNNSPVADHDLDTASIAAILTV